MTDDKLEAVDGSAGQGRRCMAVPRCVALLGGTTTLADCRVALRYLTSPRQLVQGPRITEYEQAFAQQVGVLYAYSFSSGRVGLYGLLRALGVENGDEVLLQVPTPISWFPMPSATRVPSRFTWTVT
jgi:hypothetical protein